MAPPARNLINLTGVGKEFASRTVLADISLGVGAGQRIGIVGRNGDGKSTLLRIMAGIEQPDSGVVTRTSGFDMALVGQGDELDPGATIRHELVADRPDHEWAGDPRFRSVLEGLLGGVELTRFPNGLDTVIGPLSGGERRRIALAKSLIDSPDLLLLDEPTNHLDLEAVDWLARHLAGRRGKALIVITHDRWFLDAVVQQTWEVADTTVHQYEGGYAAYVLARAERDRQQQSRDAKRVQLVKKELAWLRRGPPARTSKPKFRIEAANELIADVPEIRDTVELVKFAGTRLGNKVIDAEHIGVTFGDRVLLNDITWRLGPGDRFALVGVNGAGKSTLIRVLTGDVEPTTGEVDKGATVKIALLSQDTAEIPGHLRVLESLQEVRQSTKTADGTEVTAGKLAERFGFKGSRAGTLVKDLSGGERRRLQLMRLLMTEPNVLILDEPTNDLDIDTLNALEDLLDSWAGTLIVVSHDRYFVERVTDNVYAIAPGGGLRHLTGGIEQYIEIRKAAVASGNDSSTDLSMYGDDDGSAGGSAKPAASDKPKASGAEIHAARKSLGKLERQITKLDTREQEIHAEMAAAAADFALLKTLTAELTTVRESKETAEAAWLAATELLEG